MTHQLWILVVPGSQLKEPLLVEVVFLSLSITALKCFILSYQRARAIRHKLCVAYECVSVLGKKKILPKMCICVRVCCSELDVCTFGCMCTLQLQGHRVIAVCSPIQCLHQNLTQKALYPPRLSFPITPLKTSLHSVSQCVPQRQGGISS